MGRNLKLKKQHSAMNRMKIKIHFFLIPLLRRRLRRRYLRTATPSFKICAIRTTSIILTKRWKSACLIKIHKNKYKKTQEMFCWVCIRQYRKNTQKPALQGRNESTDRRVRTLFLYIPIKLQSAHWFFLKIFCRMKAQKTQEVFTMKSIYEEAGGTYTRQGDYELPNLKVPPEKEI